MIELSDIEWCLLDLLLRAKRKGVRRVNRLELLKTGALPDKVKLQLVYTAMVMSNGEYVALHGQHDFEITSKGEQIFLARFARPSPAADSIIALPDRSREVLQ